MLMFIIIRKVLPKSHLQKLFPDQARKIKSASGRYQDDQDYSESSRDKFKKEMFSLVPIGVGAGVIGSTLDEPLEGNTREIL